MTKPRTGQSGNWDRERADRLQEDVERMQKDVERLTAEREWSEDRFPCDGACVDAPEETCSRHGRNPADLWRIIGEVAAERNALAAAHARESEKVWKVEEVMDDIEGSDPTTWERLRAALAGPEADTTDVDVCSGDADCTSTLHVHGCFADTTGPCTDPDEHQPTAGSGWVEREHPVCQNVLARPPRGRGSV
jgi:hypothetical protein